MPRLKTPKRERFCREYLKDLDGAKAAIRAGYSKKTARTIASEMLTKPDIKARIAELQKPIEAKIEDDAVMLRNNLRLMSQVEITDFFEDDGTLKPFSEMPKGARMMFSGFELSEDMLGKMKIGEIKKIKLESKLKAMDMLGRHFAVSAWEENINLHDVDDRVARIRRAQERAGKRSGGKNGKG